MNIRNTLLMALAVGAACSLASAGISPLGDPIIGNSWGQQFEFSVPKELAFDQLAVRWASGSPFEVPETIREFQPAGWSVVLNPADLAVATGDRATANLIFEVWFENTPDEPVSFSLDVWQPGEHYSFEEWTLSWSPDPGDCVWQADPGGGGNPSPIPVPGAALLGAVGLATVSWVRRRMVG